MLYPKSCCKLSCYKKVDRFSLNRDVKNFVCRLLVEMGRVFQHDFIKSFSVNALLIYKTKLNKLLR